MSYSDRHRTDDGYRLWVNQERTVLVRIWIGDGHCEVVTREDPKDTWGPPVTCEEEYVK